MYEIKITGQIEQRFSEAIFHNLRQQASGMDVVWTEADQRDLCLQSASGRDSRVAHWWANVKDNVPALSRLCPSTDPGTNTYSQKYKSKSSSAVIVINIALGEG